MGIFFGDQEWSPILEFENIRLQLLQIFRKNFWAQRNYIRYTSLENFETNANGSKYKRVFSPLKINIRLWNPYFLELCTI